MVLLIFFFFSLGWITGYGKTEKVPSVVGLDVAAAQKNLKAFGFDVVLQACMGAQSEAELLDIQATNSGSLERFALIEDGAEARVAAIVETRMAELSAKGENK